MSDKRLIESWLPIAEIGEESVRERRSMTALPPTYYLHVWWARRPLVASRAAVLASLLPADADHDTFMRVLGIHGDPVKAIQKIERSKKAGQPVGGDAYGYPRSFLYSPDEADLQWLRETSVCGQRGGATILDPTAGGGSIPFETVRLSQAVIGNDLNPVASLILRATVSYPAQLGPKVIKEYDRIGKAFLKLVESKSEGVYPIEPANTQVLGYLWARRISCPYCEGRVPLSPDWRLSADGTGLRLCCELAGGPGHKGRHVTFELVGKLSDQSPGTAASGDSTCPFPDCGRVIDATEIKRQAKAGLMDEQLYAVCFKSLVTAKSKSGKTCAKWERTYRAPTSSDDNMTAVADKVRELLPEWEALDLVPNERFPELCNDDRPIQYGMPLWRDLFSPRQLFCHVMGVAAYRELLQQEKANRILSPETEAAFIYLSLGLDKMLNYSCRLTRWISQRDVIAGKFDRHDFALKWSYAEMPTVITGKGYEWVIGQTAKSLRELVDLLWPNDARMHATGGLNFSQTQWKAPAITITCKSGDTLDNLADNSIDAVVMDPPYYDNVMYAELSDFFYVWLKRTAGQVLPELFRRSLTDKESEAVANPAKFRDQKGAKKLAGRDYQERMASIFTECRRVLKPDGIMTLMFTHKATGAWDALTKGLLQAGFTITASWPINTEAEGSLHIKDKAAANSTIFLACRPRPDAATGKTDATVYWEDVEPQVMAAVRQRVEEFQAAGIRGVDLYLASFGPALQKFSEFWPLKRGTPKQQPASRRKAQMDLFPEEWDPYEVLPEDALDSARREVKRWRLEQLTHRKAKAELDARTSWFVLAWDAFQAPVFPYDEALRLARAVGVDLDKDIVNSLCAKKGSDLVLWDSAQRAAKGALGPADGSRGMIDALHHAAYQGRTKTLEAARELIERAGILEDPAFTTAMQAVLEVLPVGKTFSNVDLPDDVVGAGNDFEAIEKLRRLAFTQQVEQPRQLELWQDQAGAELVNTIGK